MANLTRETDADVGAFIDQLPSEQRRAEARALCALLEELVGEPPAMWGTSIIGFGRYHYRYESGREGDMCRIGFSPRKADLVLYLMGGLARHAVHLGTLGKHRTSVSCLYLKHLSDAGSVTLRALLIADIAYMDAAYPR